MAIPVWADFEAAERAAATMSRGLTGASAAWGTLLASAQAVLAARTDDPDAAPATSYEFDEWRDLIAAARVLDLAATESGLADEDNRRAAAILAACAFGMSGTSVSAAAVIATHGLLEAALTAGELTALALSAPALGRQLFPRLPEDSPSRRCVENLTAFLAQGDEESFGAANEALADAIRGESSPWESYLLRLSRLSLVHAGRLAASAVLREHSSRFPTGYVDRLVADSPMLLPSQYEAILDHGVLDSARNLLITLPTGTGKTLLGEIALLASLGRAPGLVCYIAPYVALGRQVAEKFMRHTPPGVRVHRLMGGYQEPEPLDPDNRAEIVVATPERFDAMIRLQPDLLTKIRCVVFDEAHMIGNSERGIRLEGVLTRLRLAALRGADVPRFVLLSAVLSNSDALAEWIGIAPENVIRGTWRPSAKRLLRWTEDGGLRLYSGDDPLRGDPSEVLGEARLPWPHVGFYPAKNFGGIRAQEPNALANIAFLADYQYQQYQQPVLCVCATRPRTRHLADQIALRFPPIEPLPVAIRQITDLIDERYKYLRPLREGLLRGVAYHNSSLPHDVREGIERAVSARVLKVVAATTTLAEGVDLPFRVTVLADWLVFDGEKSRPMESLLFKNIAGRCGRAGQFTEGDTVIFDNPVGDAELTTPSRRSLLQEDIFFASTQPALRSALSRLDRSTAVAAVGSQLLAAIHENPLVDDLSGNFFRMGFASRTAEGDASRQRVEAAFAQILDASEGSPLAVAASPAQLTDFGQAANASGLSPASARRLRQVLSEIPDAGSTRADLVRIGSRFLRDLASVPEQTNPDLRKAVESANSRPIVRLDDIEIVLHLWLAGESIETIFAALPSNQRSKRRPGLQTWLDGVSEDSTWTDQFAKFYDFVNGCLQFFLPWMLRAARSMEALQVETGRPWREWAEFVESGADSPWAVRLITGGATDDRMAAVTLGKRLDDLDVDAEELSVEQVQALVLEIQNGVPDGAPLAGPLLAIIEWFRDRRQQ